MGAVTGEADQKRWTLVLDADNATLARYYERFGFTRLARRPAQRDGAPVRMARPPRHAEGSSK
jgi:ribosomal protein S18 acetylase RimI-like enzyme